MRTVTIAINGGVFSVRGKDGTDEVDILRNGVWVATARCSGTELTIMKSVIIMHDATIAALARALGNAPEQVRESLRAIKIDGTQGRISAYDLARDLLRTPAGAWSETVRAARALDDALVGSDLTVERAVDALLALSYPRHPSRE